MDGFWYVSTLQTRIEIVLRAASGICATLHAVSPCQDCYILVVRLGARSPGRGTRRVLFVKQQQPREMSLEPAKQIEQSKGAEAAENREGARPRKYITMARCGDPVRISFSLPCPLRHPPVEWKLRQASPHHYVQGQLDGHWRTYSLKTKAIRFE